jgi:hypothetical protein
VAHKAVQRRPPKWFCGSCVNTSEVHHIVCLAHIQKAGNCEHSKNIAKNGPIALMVHDGIAALNGAQQLPTQQCGKAA